MTRHFPNSLRRAAALAMSLLMALAQLAAPAAALAETMVDVAQLPTVTLYYQISAEDEVPTPRRRSSPIPVRERPFTGLCFLNRHFSSPSRST